MAALEDLRVRLDGIDEQIVRLYEERMKICEEVGELKVRSEEHTSELQSPS